MTQSSKALTLNSFRNTSHRPGIWRAKQKNSFSFHIIFNLNECRSSMYKYIQVCHHTHMSQHVHVSHVHVFLHAPIHVHVLLHVHVDAEVLLQIHVSIDVLY